MFMTKDRKIEDLVKDAGRIGISGHIRPDGDCIGSVMGLYLYLRKKYPEKQIQVFLDQPPREFSCIKDLDQIQSSYRAEQILEEQGRFDVFFAMDTAKDRLGEAEKLFDTAAQSVNIDHHITNHGSGAVNYLDGSASSTSELVCRLLSWEELDCDIAQALYIGIMHDTGVFQYSNTSRSTMETAGRLMEYGFDFPMLIDQTFYEKTYVQNLLLGRALLNSILFMDGRCIVSEIEKRTLEFYQASSEDISGVVSQLIRTKGVECAIFMYPTGVLEYKVSMRSKGKVDVAAIAQYFGGGGHVRAAGCTMNGTFHDVVNNLSLHIENQLG